MSNYSSSWKEKGRIIVYKVASEVILDRGLLAEIVENIELARELRREIQNPFFVELELGEIYYSTHGETGLQLLIAGFEAEGLELKDFKYNEDYNKVFFEVI